MPGGRQVVYLLALLSALLLIATVLLNFHGYAIPVIDRLRSGSLPSFHAKGDPESPTLKPIPHPKYKPKPDYLPPPIRDNFPLLTTSDAPPPIPKWNVPSKPDLHVDFGLPVAPPLLIGFTRTWPLLLQAVTSYLTAGWPASQIYVVENTGVQQANTRGQLTLQNPFHLNHTTLHKLGVNILQTPTLLTFAQLQNYFLAQSYAHEWPYYFWSHMDVLALSYEAGNPDKDVETEPYTNASGYKSIYSLALRALSEAHNNDPRWGIRFFSYDHLAAVNPKAYEDVGGWDTLIPYYITDCDMHSRLAMRGWTMNNARVGIITDVSTALEDLAALYRVEGVEAKFTDPNPPAPAPASSPRRRSLDDGGRMGRRYEYEDKVWVHVNRRDGEGEGEKKEDENLEKWFKLSKTAEGMFHYKHGGRGRNTWQTGQHGGQGEPFYYDAAGLAEAIELETEFGREVYRRKWGHRDCDLREGAGLGFDDQWLVEKDWS